MCEGLRDVEDLAFAFLCPFSEVHSDNVHCVVVFALKPELAYFGSVPDLERSNEPAMPTVDGRKVYRGQDETPSSDDSKTLSILPGLGKGEQTHGTSSRINHSTRRAQVARPLVRA